MRTGVTQNYLLTYPIELAGKLEMFDNLRTTSRREPIPDYRKRGFQKPKDEGPRMENNRKPPYPKKYEKSKPERNADERPPIRCFGCNEPGVIRAKCPRCSPQGTNETARFGNIQLHSCTDESSIASESERDIWNRLCGHWSEPLYSW
ncbi:hypothetical protein JTE90_009508 [Oedothorax gibbosus]|uniref:CCHC-type domain-containing protein n=1 Tax=Oedothorax gibbosus TaxID=931172 RepID=A0AAV6UT51_9ARAC|nr:hypothetical protein JTE90_009508 [Oedothorax gibbosus]